MMNRKEFAKFLKRDLGRCYHCGISDETLIPQHRSNRGMGGGGSNDASNIIVLCSLANGLLESDPQFALQGRENGWKLNRWQDSSLEPVYDAYGGFWVYLDDDYGRWRAHNLN